MNRWYSISLWCGLLPLCTGTTIFFTWLIIRADWLMLAGIFTIYAGLVLFCTGTMSLAVYFFKARANKSTGYWKKSIVALIILLANFPAAATILSAVLYKESASSVTVVNNSEYKIEDIYLSDRVHRYEIGSLSPHELLVNEIHFKSEGSVGYSYTSNGIKYKGTLFGYVTGGLAVSANMVITESGEVEIIEK